MKLKEVICLGSYSQEAGEDSSPVLVGSKAHAFNGVCNLKFVEKPPILFRKKNTCVCVYRKRLERYNEVLALGSMSGCVMGYFQFYFVHLTIGFEMFALTMY